jgi:hypothetical protein
MHVGVAVFMLSCPAASCNAHRSAHRSGRRETPRRASGLESEGEYNPHPPPPNLRGRVL